MTTTTRRGLLHVTLACALLGAGACDGLLDVSSPGNLTAEQLQDPKMAPVLEIGMLADFECAFQGYAYTSSVLSGEFDGTITARADLIWYNRVVDVDLTSGLLGCTVTGGAFLPLQVARFQAQELHRLVKSFPAGALDNTVSEQLLGSAAVHAAYSYTLLGEGFCAMSVDIGPIMTRKQTFDSAEVWFTEALAHTTTADIRNMALVGRARARLNSGNMAGAFADATLVPLNFNKTITGSASVLRRQNQVFLHTIQNREASVAPAYRGLTVNGVADNRVVAVLSPLRGQDNVSPLWLQQKYLTITAPRVLAGWKEAQLIIAESRGGQEAVDAINRLRTAANLPQYSSTDPVAIAAQVIEERRREFFLDGQRLGDMLRLDIPFRTGTTNKGEPYGSITCIPLPATERRVNPNLANYPLTITKSS
jgi:starch-binding outer membrane protein, SusD/RagB family